MAERTDEFLDWQRGAEIGGAPAVTARSRGHDHGAEFMQLPRRRGENQMRRRNIFRIGAGEGFEELGDLRGGEMFVRNIELALASKTAAAFRQGCNEALQDRGRTEFHRRPNRARLSAGRTAPASRANWRNCGSDAVAICPMP